VRLHLALSGREPVKTHAADQADDAATAGSLIA
jgi:hypothetical protein